MSSQSLDELIQSARRAWSKTQDQLELDLEGVNVFYVHKYEVQQCYGGPEEGGWWFDAGEPVETVAGYVNEDMAIDHCYKLNMKERKRREEEESYGYTSVLSYCSTFYEYDVSTDPVAKPFPTERPHYE